jgi:glutathione synthase/RimK-type ligase-like ATP-grasp enzyme
LGIQIVSKEEVSTHAPLYTEYIKKKKEFRVHVWDGKVIDVQEKRRKDGFESAKVRNTANGYVFCRMGIRPPAGLDSLAVSAVAALGRTYGGVDIIWNEHHNKSYVLEVNSRPGMEGTTVTKYADAILSAAYYAEGEML